MADLNQLAARLVKQATDPQPESPAQASGRKGGLKGGKARAESLSPAERSAQARHAARGALGAVTFPARTVDLR